MRILFHNEKCDICGKCIEACQNIHGAPRLKVEQDGAGVIQCYQCKQCAKPACAYACTYELIYRNKETGAIEIYSDECQACHACVRACPFQSVFVHPESDVALICDLCHGEPNCVSVCPTGALVIKKKEK